MSWASEELRTVKLGTALRNRQLVAIGEDLAASPETRPNLQLPPTLLVFASALLSNRSHQL